MAGVSLLDREHDPLGLLERFYDLNRRVADLERALAGESGLLAHAAQHILGGTDEIDADQLDISWNPSNYTPSTSPSEVDNVDHLTAHLYGIDQAIGAGASLAGSVGANAGAVGILTTATTIASASVTVASGQKVFVVVSCGIEATAGGVERVDVYIDYGGGQVYESVTVGTGGYHYMVPITALLSTTGTYTVYLKAVKAGTGTTCRVNAYRGIINCLVFG